MKLKTCPITNSKDSFVYLDLGNVPLVNNLCSTREEALKVKKYPLAVQYFRESRLSCITEIVNKDKLFLNYLYQSGVNKPFLSHCSEMYDYLDEFIGLRDGDLVIDIGGNDGSLLIEFRKKNPNLMYINVDASKSFIDINRNAGITYINQFFDENFVGLQKADLIVSTNVFQHTLPIRSFVRGVYKNLKDGGYWCIEFPYLLTTLLNDNYDQIYHEHVFYFLLQNIIDLLSQEDMKVVNVSFHDIHSGTLRVICTKKCNFRKPDFSVSSFLALEKVLTEDYYIEWGKRTKRKINKFREFIFDLKSQGNFIACFGAAAKGCVFLNTCRLNDDIIDFIIDDTPFKQGKYVPGTGLKIVSRSILNTLQPDYLIILAHNFKDYIINSLEGQYFGKYIIMFPDINVF